MEGIHLSSSERYGLKEKQALIWALGKGKNNASPQQASSEIKANKYSFTRGGAPKMWSGDKSPTVLKSSHSNPCKINCRHGNCKVRKVWKPSRGGVLMTSTNRKLGVTTESRELEGETLGVFPALTRTEHSLPTQTSSPPGKHIPAEGGFFTRAVTMWWKYTL